MSKKRDYPVSIRRVSNGFSACPDRLMSGEDAKDAVYVFNTFEDLFTHLREHFEEPED